MTFYGSCVHTHNSSVDAYVVAHDIVIIYDNLITVVVVDVVMLFTHLIQKNLYLEQALQTEFP